MKIKDREKLIALKENMISLLTDIDNNNIIMLDVKNELVAMCNFIGDN